MTLRRTRRIVAALDEEDLTMRSRLTLILTLLGAGFLFVAGEAEAAFDLKTEYVAPANLPNNEAQAGPSMTITIKVTNLGPDRSNAVRLSLYKYDHTCGGYPKNRPTPQYLEVGELALHGSAEFTFTDSNTALPSGSTAMTVCYKTGIQTSSGGYYTDANSANHTSGKAVKYVATTSSTGSTALAISVTNLKASRTSCGPGEHWVEATVSSTQPTTANITVDGTPGGIYASRTATLQAGSNAVRATVRYPQAGTYGLRFSARSGIVEGSTQQTVTIPDCTSVSTASITITQPAGAESVTAGQSVNVRWASSGNPGTTVRIELLHNDAVFRTLAQNSANDGNETVTIPADTPTTSNARIRVATGTVAGVSNRFTVTGQAASITVTQPAGGESVAAGQSVNVRWNRSGDTGAEAHIDLWRDGSLFRRLASNTANDGTEAVTIPADTAATSNARIRIMTSNNVIGQSNPFAVTGGTPASITVTQPAGGESVNAGQAVTIRWTSSGNPGSQVRIDLLRDGALFRTLSQNSSNDGSESVTIPADTPATSNARISVIASSAGGTSNPFTVTTQTAGITVTSPSAGQQLLPGATTTVTWNSSGNPGNAVNIRLSLNNGSTWTTLASNVANDGSELVTLPKVYKFSENPGSGDLISAAQAKIEVASISVNTRGESGTFTIRVPALTFNGHFYNMIADRCSMCHPNSGSSMLHPQKARASDDPSSSVNETVAPVIPFDRSITAVEMLTRLKTIKAASGDYQRALDKIYVVPNDPDRSGLHFKAQDSTSSIFREDLTIENVTMKIRDWITLWIKQGGS